MDITQPRSEPPDSQPSLCVVIDTEEEFDWYAPFDRQAVAVTHMAAVAPVQSLFERHGITPTYVVDYAIASQEAGVALLKAFQDDKKALIGTHLHPWISPPLTEALCLSHSYPGNLPKKLEQEKLSRLTETIGQAFGQIPTIYKAGRYGFGPNSAEILTSLGYLVDLSPAPGFDFRADGGPNYLDESNHPRFLDETSNLFCLPDTGAIIGALHRFGPTLHPLLLNPRLAALRLPGIFSRLRLLERIRLSPEGFTLAELKRLTRFLLAGGIRSFHFSFHSPSWQPGHTPYVRNQSDLDRFMAILEGYFDFFLRELGGRSQTPLEIRDRFLNTPFPG
ncbi:MAG: WalW protein [Magnetococcales bacterium]|nr:WalW protein [Magnetococcales bacterium]